MSAAQNTIPQGNKSTSEKKLVQLTVKVGDASAEVFLIDSDLSLVARDIGGLDEKLPPGIYKVRVRTGFLTSEKLLVLRSDPVTESFGASPFSSPVPLANTAKTHEYHEAAAEQESQKTHVQAGQGSSIFVFVREWTPPGSSSAAPTSIPNPATGLTLKAQDGTVVADVERTSSKSDSPFPGSDPWAACSIVLNPGAYRLGVSTPQGEYEQSIIAPKDWHVNVFLMLRNYEANDQQERKADLASAAVTLSSSRAFVPNNDARLVELARLGLTQKRKVLSRELRSEILGGKFNDPMLGIFGGHLLLLEDKVDLQLLSQVVANLRYMVGSEHPDVEALAVALNERGRIFEVRVPPMLQRSWQVILDGTADQRAMVMRDGLAAQIIKSTCSGEPWLLWTSLGSSAQVQESDLEEVLKRHIFGRQSDVNVSVKAPKQPARAKFSNMLVLGVEAMAGAKESGGALEARGEAEEVQAEAEALPVETSTSISPDKMRELIRRMGVPRFCMEDLLKKLNVTVTEK
jgi:hypothetical protein